MPSERMTDVSPGSTAHRCGHVAILGRPNVGKSTLVNRLVGTKLSITSAKAQTTRHRIVGVVTRPDAQFLLLDTPGYQTRNRGALNRVLNRTAAQAAMESDVVVLVADAQGWTPGDDKALALVPAGKPIVIALNKIDAVLDKAKLLPLAQRLAGHPGVAAIVPISARNGRQVDELLDECAKHLPEGEAQFEADEAPPEVAHDRRQGPQRDQRHADQGQPVEFPSEDGGTRDIAQSCCAAGDRSRCQHPAVDGESEGQRGESEMEARQSCGQHPEHGCRCGRDRDRDRHRPPDRPSRSLDEDGHGIGPDGEIRVVGEIGVPTEHHGHVHPESEERVDEEQRRDILVVGAERCVPERRQHQQQGHDPRDPFGWQPPIGSRWAAALGGARDHRCHRIHLMYGVGG